MANNKFPLLVAGVVLLLSACAYIIGSYRLWNQTDKLSGELENLQNELRVIETKLKSERTADPNALSRHDEKVVKRKYHELMQRCDNADPTVDSIEVIRRLLANDISGAREKFLEVRRPKVHVTPRKNHTVHPSRGERTVTYWKRNHDAGKTFKCNFEFKNNRMRVLQDGRYYVYSQVKFHYKRHHQPSLHRHCIKLKPAGTNLQTTVVENNYYLGNEDEGDEVTGTKVSNHGAALVLSKGDELYVKAWTGEHSRLVTSYDADTFFGMYMVS